MGRKRETENRYCSAKENVEKTGKLFSRSSCGGSETTDLFEFPEN